MIIEVEKSQDLSPAKWRTRNPDGKILLESKDLRTKRDNDLSSCPSSKAQGLEGGMKWC